MNIPDLSLSDYLTALSSSAPTPGGGAVAACSAAQGAALAAMVCAISGEKPGPHQAQLQATLPQLQALQTELKTLMDQDAQAYAQLSACFKLPKSTPEEQEGRSTAIQRELAHCALPPLRTMERSLQTLELTASLLGKASPSLATDLAVAAQCLSTALQSAWLNVLVNVNSLKDRAQATALGNQGQALLDTALPLAENIYQDIAQSLTPKE